MRIEAISWCLALGLTLNASAGDQDGVVGRNLAFARDKGNCLACHVIAGGSQMGDIGPPLVGIAARFPDRQRLYDQIWDAGRFNDPSLMPPFGRHEILSDSEIDAIVQFLYTL